MKIKNFVKYFKEEVFKYFKNFMKFLIFNEIFHRASLPRALHSKLRKRPVKSSYHPNLYRTDATLGFRLGFLQPKAEGSSD